MRTVVGLHDHFEDAQRVVQALHEAGFDRNKISLIASDSKGEYKRYLQGQAGEKTEDIAEGAATGAGIGAVLGGLGGVLVGLGALAIPGIGPVLAAGPIAAGLAGAGIGAAAGGVIGGLVELGIPEEQANQYAEGVRRGGTLVTLQTDDTRADQAVQIMNRFNPVDINRRTQDWRKENWTRFDETAQPMTDLNRQKMVRDDVDETTIPVVEEDIQIGKREVESGVTHVNAYVEEQPVEKDIHLRREHVEVERRKVDRDVTGDEQFVEGEFDIHTTEEEAMVRKQARVVEEVRIRKDVEEDVETVRDTVRRQRVEVTDMTDTDWETYTPRFQEHYRTQYGGSGRDFNYFQSAYQYGYHLGGDERYRNMDWRQLEPAARQWWEGESAHRGIHWRDVSDAVRHGWEIAGRE